MVASQAQPQLIPKSIVHTCSVCQTDIDAPLTNGRLPLSTKCPNCGTEYTFQQTKPHAKSLLDYAPEDRKVLVDAIGDPFRKYQEGSSHGQRRIAYTISFTIQVLFAI